MNCPNCPAPIDCRRLKAHCRWAAEQPPDPLKIRHIVESARMRRMGEAATATVTQPEHDQRMSVCLYCNFLDTELDHCRIAGQNIHSKTRLKYENCPKGLW